MSYLTITGTGRLGRDAELRFTKSGSPMLSFTIATDELKKTLGRDYQPEKTETAWIDCTLFGSLAEVLVEKMTKGALVTVHGDLVPRTWTDAEGKQQSKLQVRIKSCAVIEKAKEAAPTPASDPWSKPVEPVDVSNVPF